MISWLLRILRQLRPLRLLRTCLRNTFLASPALKKYALTSVALHACMETKVYFTAQHIGTMRNRYD